MRPLVLAAGLTCLTSAQAVNECGPASSGGSIVCDMTTYVPTDGRIVYNGLSGLTLTATGLGLVAPPLNNHHGIFVGTGSGATGIASTGTIRIRFEDGSIVTGNPLNIGSAIANTEGRYGDGLRSENYGTGDTVVSVGGTITTYGYNAMGAYAWQRQAQASGPVHVQADMDRGSVRTHGAFSHGLHARSESGQGSTAVIMRGGEVITRGNNSIGLFAQNVDTLSGGEGSVRIEASDSLIETSGRGSSGIVARNRLTGHTSVETRDTTVATSGMRATGIVAESLAGEVSVRLAGGSLSTLGSEAHGLHAIARGGDATVVTSADIRTAQTDSVGVLAEASGDVVINHSGVIDSGGSAVVAVAGGRVTIQNQGTVVSQTGHAIDVSGASQGATINNRGTLRASTPGTYAVLGSAASDLLILSGGRIEGAVNLGAGNDRFVASAGTLAGTVDMGQGDDVLVLRGSVTLSRVPRLDGGDGNDRLEIDAVALRAFTGASDRVEQGVNLSNWQVIAVTGGGALKLSGDLFEEGSDGQLRIGGNSVLDLRGNSPGRFTVHGSITNAGIMTLADGAPDDRTVVTGNYQGARGSAIVLDAQFDGDDSASDQLHIRGDTRGQSILVIEPTGGAGAQTVRGIRLIQVDGSSGPESFVWDVGTLQVGNYQYVLKRGSAEDPNDWFLVSHVALPVEDGTTPALGGGLPLWRPAIGTYSVVRSLNADTAFLKTGTLHQRQGHETATDRPRSAGTAWGRYLGQNLNARGQDRFSYRNRTRGFQVGRDLDIRASVPDGRQHVGFLAHYAEDLARAWDHLRREAGLESETGRIRSASVGAGAYRTTHNADGSYSDWVVHVNRIDNRFNDSLGEAAQQPGWQLVISQEIAHPWWQQGLWSMQWHAQWLLLHTRYGAFEDAHSRLPAQSFDALRGRLGLHLRKHHAASSNTSASSGSGLQFHGTAHLVHDLLKTRGMALIGHGSDRLDRATESFDQTYLELGVGAQLNLPSDSWLWTDARYEWGLRNRKSTGRVSLGIATRF